MFEANEKANELPIEELEGLIAQVTGSEKNIVEQIAYTFNAIAKSADSHRRLPSRMRRSLMGKVGQHPQFHRFPK